MVPRCLQSPRTADLPFHVLAGCSSYTISRILVPMNDPEMASRALERALEDDLEEAAEEHAQAVFDRARELAAEHDAEITTDVQFGHPTRAILNRVHDFDAVVVGSHSGSVSDRLFVGTVAENVFRRFPVSTVVVR